MKGRKGGGRAEMERKEERGEERATGGAVKRATGGGIIARKRGGSVHGKKPEHRMDKRARGGRMTPKSPLSGATVKEMPFEKGPKTSADEDDLRRARGGHITASERQALPKSDFALPGKGTGPKGAGAGSYLIDTENRARNALARGAQHASAGELATIKRKVHAKYPDIGQK